MYDEKNVNQCIWNFGLTWALIAREDFIICTIILQRNKELKHINISRIIKQIQKCIYSCCIRNIFSFHQDVMIYTRSVNIRSVMVKKIIHYLQRFKNSSGQIIFIFVLRYYHIQNAIHCNVPINIIILGSDNKLK